MKDSAGLSTTYGKCPSTGSTQGIGFGVLRGLASAGADVVMHGLLGPSEFEEKVASLQEEFGVKVGHSSADVRNPEEIRHVSEDESCCKRRV